MSSYDFIFEGDQTSATVDKQGDVLRIKVGEREFDFRKIGENHYSSYVNGHRSTIAVVKHKGVYYIDFDSLHLEVHEPSEDGFAGGDAGHAGAKDKIFAPMPGKIVKIMVAVGDEVTVKQPMVVVEAMKMENQVNAKAAGKVKAVNFEAGDQVDTEQPIIELELDETAAPKD
jgi:biotin carboxyl carrier protein